MAIIYAPTGETFRPGVNNVYFNGERQCHVGVIDNSNEVGIAYDCNTACVNIWSLSSQITDWALEARGKPAYWDEYQVRLRYCWRIAPSGGITFCDCWQGGQDSYKVVYTTISNFSPNACFCACIYGYGCSPRHFVASAPFGSCSLVSCIYTTDDYANIYFECRGGWTYTDWQDISCWEYDLLYNVGFRPDISFYSCPSYDVITQIRGKNPDGSYYCCGIWGKGTVSLYH